MKRGRQRKIDSFRGRSSSSKLIPWVFNSFFTATIVLVCRIIIKFANVFTWGMCVCGDREIGRYFPKKYNLFASADFSGLIYPKPLDTKFPFQNKTCWRSLKHFGILSHLWGVTNISKNTFMQQKPAVNRLF